MRRSISSCDWPGKAADSTPGEGWRRRSSEVSVDPGAGAGREAKQGTRRTVHDLLADLVGVGQLLEEAGVLGDAGHAKRLVVAAEGVDEVVVGDGGGRDGALDVRVVCGRGGGRSATARARRSSRLFPSSFPRRCGEDAPSKVTVLATGSTSLASASTTLTLRFLWRVMKRVGWMMERPSSVPTVTEGRSGV